MAISNIKYQISNIKKIKSIDDVIHILLENRGIRTKKEKEEFLNPDLKKITAQSVGIDKTQLKKAIARIEKAKKENEQVVIFGDYDVDGLCATAILWETLNSIGLKVLPYIPSRIDEGYGLSKASILNLKSKILNPKLIITVDNGITANEAVDFAKKEGIEVIITDHHLPAKKLPKAFAIVHTTKLAGAGVAWDLAHELKVKSSKLKIKEDDHLDLVAVATVADLVPLTNANRVLVKFGLEDLRKTKRIGLLELFKEAGLGASQINTYDIGHIIAPRLNAAGRIGDALESLRLLCTKDPKRAEGLAMKLGLTNKERRGFTEEATEHALSKIKNSLLRQGSGGQAKIKKLLFIADESYQQGIIGLVAGRLSDEFYRPAIVISKGEVYSKASARSIKGINIIEFIRKLSEFLVNAGGHPMAAGFTVETANLALLEKKFEELAEKLISDSHLVRKQRIDCEISLELVTFELYALISMLEPFGMANPTPVFSSKAIIEDIRLVGQEGKHLKLKLKIQNSKFKIDGIGFGIGEMVSRLHIGDEAKIVYSISQDTWNGNKRLQLKIKTVNAF